MRHIISMKDIGSSVEATEIEAEKILEEAKAKASEILLKAKEETKTFLSSQLAMDEVKAEYEKIIAKAKVEAEKRIEDSKKKASEVSSKADKKIAEIAEHIVNIVTGGNFSA